MTMGEKIYTLRTQHNMSQGDLADKLNVSRQSISKWENNNSTPDLEKIVKLAEIFGVTLDELIKNEDTGTPAVTAPQQTPAEHPNSREKKIGKGLLIAGVISIFAFILLGLGITGVFVAVPLFICSIIYYKAKKDHFFYCLWAVIPIVDLFVRFAMGISWTMIRQTLQWRELLGYHRLAISWVQFIVIFSLIIFSIIKYSKEKIEIDTRFKRNFIAAALGFTFLLLGELLTEPYVIKLLMNSSDYNSTEYAIVSVTNVVFNLADWIRMYLFVDITAKIIQYVKTMRN